jgi:transposase
VPDQTRSLIKKPCTYDSHNNRRYKEFAAHYGCALLAPRPAHPRDKPKVECAVLVVERWTLARLRKFHFASVDEVNALFLENPPQKRPLSRSFFMSKIFALNEKKD